MINVSNSYKKAIKQNNREIKGYIEALYDVRDIKPLVSLECNWYHASLSNLNQVIDNKRKGENYAFIDNDNSLLLDGTYVMPRINENNDGMGIVSVKPYNQIPILEKSIIITLSKKQTIRYLTFLWKDNIITNYTIQLFNETGIVANLTQNNSDLNMIIDLKQEYDITDIKFIINDVEISENRIRLIELDFGISAIYEGSDLISFEVREQVKKFVEDVPTNECTINLNNYDGKFDILNPNGMTKYLNSNAVMKPHIGVLTEDNGIEYCPMGEFYITNFSNNMDKTTTLTCSNLMYNLKQLPLVCKYSSSMDGKYSDSFMNNDKLKKYVEKNYDIDIEIDTYQDIGITTYTTKYESLINFLQEATLIKQMIFHLTRNKIIKLRDIDKTIKSEITLNDLKDQIRYEKIDKIDSVDMIREKSSTEVLNTPSSLSETVTLKSQIEYHKIDTGSFSAMNNNVVVSQIGAISIEKLDVGTRMLFVKIVGTVGSTVTINVSNITSKYDYSNMIKNINNNLSPKQKIDIKSNLLLMDPSYKVGEYVLKNASGYNVSFEYNGDPSIEAGDYVSVETDYGPVNLFVEDNYFKFDGGLSGSIGGVE